MLCIYTHFSDICVELIQKESTTLKASYLSLFIYFIYSPPWIASVGAKYLTTLSPFPCYSYNNPVRVCDWPTVWIPQLSHQREDSNCNLPESSQLR